MPPLYDYVCSCGQYAVTMRSVADRHNAPSCPLCQRTMSKTISKAAAHSDVDIVTDDIDGVTRHISSRRELKRILQQAEVVEKFGKGWV